MKIVQINATCATGSTGKICVSISQLLTKKGVDNTLFYTLGKSDYDKGVKYSSLAYTKMQALKSKVLGEYGFNSKHSTKKLIRALEKLSPDVVHLHNLHAHNLHLGLLFDYLRNNQIKVYWTFHDCWSFTAYCPFFDMKQCDRWQTGCYDCPQRKHFSWFFDKSRKTFQSKKELIQGIDLTVITPSVWLSELVKKSFFKDCPIKVINNGINLSIYRPTKGDFRRRYGLENKRILLGVAFGWGKRKGLESFCELAKRLDDRYQIVLVGTDRAVERKLPDSILSIRRTADQRELASLYTAADLFVNPTMEENYPTVNMEALACGTPIVTYETGGSAEIGDDSCRIVVPRGDVDALEKAIYRVFDENCLTRESCLAFAKRFDQNDRFADMIALYEEAKTKQKKTVSSKRLALAQINATCGSGSTGKICVSIGELLDQQKIENYVYYTMGSDADAHGVRYANRPYIKLQALCSRVFANYGFNSRYATKRLIKHLEKLSPAAVHLHNLHAHNLHLGLLFGYLKKKKIKVYWTFHDCWAFTGYCPHYAMAGCDKWKSGCENCPQKSQYSWFFDRSATIYKRKKELFTGLDMTIITPSEWLAGEVRQSFFKDMPIQVIHNGIDLSVFQPRTSDFRKKYGLEDRFVLLGVAFGWGTRKGLDVFLELEKRLDDSFAIVLVGTDESIDKLLPDTIISFHRTADQKELAEIYTAADLFVNPTREEVLGLVNLEALACGTPVVTSNAGGSPECVDETCGVVVPSGDVDVFYHAITEIERTRPFEASACIQRAKQFDAKDKFREYTELYDLS